MKILKSELFQLVLGILSVVAFFSSLVFTAWQNDKLLYQPPNMVFGDWHQIGCTESLAACRLILSEGHTVVGDDDAQATIISRQESGVYKIHFADTERSPLTFKSHSDGVYRLYDGDDYAEYGRIEWYVGSSS